MRVVAGTNQEIALLGGITLRLRIHTRSAYHEFSFVKKLPIDNLIRAEFLRRHDFRIMNKASDRDAFGIKDGNCDACVSNKEKMKAEHDPQLQATPKPTPAKPRDL